MISEKRTLGKTGLNISLTGFGAWAIGGGGYGSVATDKAINTIKTYVEHGGNHIDTAQGYADSEKLIGASGVCSNDIIIASKTANDGTAEDVKKVEDSINSTLKNLKRDYVDIYYMHTPPEKDENIDRLFTVYEKLKKDGKIRFIGASIKGPNVTDDTTELCKKYILDGRVDVIQIVYSIFRQKNSEIFELAKKHNVGIVARTALESGFLVGSYKKGHVFNDDDHRARWSRGKLDIILQETENLEKFRQTTSFEKLSQIAVKFSMQNENINSLIIGAKNVNQINQNLLIENLNNLTSEQLNYLQTTYKDFTNNCNT